MARSLAERVDDPKWIAEQILHYLLGDVVATLSGRLAAVWLDSWEAFGVALVLGILSGGIRELVQNVGDAENDYLDMAVDLGAWSLGSLRGAIGVV